MYDSYLKWIDDHHSQMIAQVMEWSAINSFSTHLDGLTQMATILKQAFQPLNASIDEVTLDPLRTISNKGDVISSPLGKALSIRKRPEAPIQVFLGGHYDTVYPPESPFQSPHMMDPHTMCGPGVTDMKGGLAVLLYALQAFERSPFANELGWEILLNPDEEIGSPGSSKLLEQSAKRNQFGLVFEPSLPDGSFVSSRKGSANFTLVVHGRSAHVGRDYAHGRSAIRVIAHFICRLEALNSTQEGLIVNVGKIEGGEANNVVPSLAIARFNIRTKTMAQMNTLIQTVSDLADEINEEGISTTLYTVSTRPPKEFEESTQQLFNHVKKCCQELNQKMEWKESGGVCDGNILAAAGLPTIDTMGVLGGKIHTPEEFLIVDSLRTKARLTALFLMKSTQRMQQ